MNAFCLCFRTEKDTKLNAERQGKGTKESRRNDLRNNKLETRLVGVSPPTTCSQTKLRNGQNCSAQFDILVCHLTGQALFLDSQCRFFGEAREVWQFHLVLYCGQSVVIKKVKRSFGPFHLMVDTSILWCQDKQVVANPEFETFWSTYGSKYRLKLVLPEVVVGELVFQHATSANKSYKRIQSEAENLSSIIGSAVPIRLHDAKIKALVQKRFNLWLRDKRARVASTPLNSINWRSLIDRSIWRLPPFESNPKDPLAEKGFRDSLILETLVDLHDNQSSINAVVFLCGDALLRDAASERLTKAPRYQSYSSLGEFESYLKLTSEQLNDQFVKFILKRAAEKFFTKGDTQTFYYQSDFNSKFRAKFSEYFSDPIKSQNENLRLLDSLFSGDDWKHLDVGKYWISPASFLRLESKNMYQWLSVVTLVQKFQRKVVLSLQPSNTLDQERILVLPFHVAWQARVASDGKFSNLQVVNIELKGNSFSMPTESQTKTWQL